MKVELSIADDRELRQHIKDVIRGEVLSIARGEIKGIIAQAVSEKAIPSEPVDVERVISEEIRKHVRKELGTSSYRDPSWIRNEARRQIGEYLKELTGKHQLV